MPVARFSPRGGANAAPGRLLVQAATTGSSTLSVNATGGVANIAELSASTAATTDSRSISELLQPLSSQDPHTRQAGCQALARPGLRGDSRVVSALVGNLQDRDQYVRQAAAVSLGQVARRGDEATLAALVARLGDADAGVRRVAVNSIGQVASRGCLVALPALLGRVEDKDGGVRRSATKALDRVAEKGDPRVHAALYGRTADSEAFVRHAAVEVLACVADEGDAEVISRLLLLLENDRDSRVRAAASDALGHLAIRGDSRVLATLLAALEDESDSVRRAAASSLGHVTFAPLKELEIQERQIAELEHRGRHEVANRDKAISEREAQHMHEVLGMQKRIEELESVLRHEVGERDRKIAELEATLRDRSWLTRVVEFIPPAAQVGQFVESLPSLAGPTNFGTEVTVPVWALRCASGLGAEPAGRRCGRTPSGHGGGGGGGPQMAHSSSMTLEEVCPDGKDRREFISLFELFEQLSLGNVTPLELTDKKPLDVYIHQGPDGVWGVYCCSRHRMLALLMRQACVRSEVLTVKCTLRPKDDQSFWGWQWSNCYDGGDGLCIQPFASTAQALASPTSASGSCSAASRTAPAGGRVSWTGAGGGGSAATPRASSASAWRPGGALPRRADGVYGGSLAAAGGSRKVAVAMPRAGSGEEALTPGRWPRASGGGLSQSRNSSATASTRGYCSATRIGDQPAEFFTPKRPALPTYSAHSAQSVVAASEVDADMAASLQRQHSVPTLTMDLAA